MNDQVTLMLDYLLSLDEGLTDWEVEFLEDLDKQIHDDLGFMISEPDVQKLEQIYKEKR